MVKRCTLMTLIAGLICCLPMALAEDEKKGADKPSDKAEKGDKEEAKFTAKCPVSGEDAKKDQFTAYKEKEVYFCCDQCKAKFEADSKEYAEKANHQLVHTKQYIQTKCPLSGADLNKEQSVKVDTVKVTFCCEKCQGAMAKASKEEQLKKIFSEEPFTKAFTAKKDDSGGDEKPESSKKEKAGAK